MNKRQKRNQKNANHKRNEQRRWEQKLIRAFGNLKEVGFYVEGTK